jgi:hypothetical protein
MRKAIAMALIVQSIYKFCGWKAMDLSFQEQKQNLSILSGSNFIAKGIQKSCKKSKKVCAL